MTYFGKYVSNFVKTAVSSISPNKIVCYTQSQYESEYQDCELLLEEHGTFMFYKVAHHFDMIYLPGVVSDQNGIETPYAYSLFRFQGEEEEGIALFVHYGEVLEPLHLVCLSEGRVMDRTSLEKVTTYCRTRSGWSAAHIASAMSWREAFSGKVIQNLLNDYDPISGLTPLRIAIQEKDVAFVEFLLTQKNMLASEKDENGNTVFHLAAAHSSKSILSLLLKHVKFQNLNTLNKFGESALHIACQENSLDCAEELMKFGISPLLGENEQFPIHIAVCNDSLECVNLLFEYCPQTISLPNLKDKSTPLHLANNPKIFEHLCDLHADLDAQNDRGLTVLHTKVRDNDLDSVINLLVRGANVNLGDFDQATPLHYAVTLPNSIDSSSDKYNSSVHIIRALLAFEADPNALNNNQHSPRHLLCRDSESYVHSDERDLVLYTLDAIGAKRCPVGTISCTAGCINIEDAIGLNLTLFNGKPPEIINHPVDIAKELIEEVLLSTNSVGLNSSRSFRHLRKKMNECNNTNTHMLISDNIGVIRSQENVLEESSRQKSLTNKFYNLNQNCYKVPKLKRNLSHDSTYSLPSSSTSPSESTTFHLASDSENEQSAASPHINKPKVPSNFIPFIPSQCRCDKSMRLEYKINDASSANASIDSLSVNLISSPACFTSETEAGDNSSNGDEIGKCSMKDHLAHLKNFNNRRFYSGSRIKGRKLNEKKWNCGPRGYRVLSLDGGGMRGLIIIQILRALEKASGKNILQLFDWIVGTSTGGAISLFLACGKCLFCCRNLLFRFSNTVFCGKRPYPSEPLELLMRQEFGENTVMTDLKHVKVAVTTLLSDRIPPVFHMFRNYKSPRDRIQRLMERRHSRSKSMAYTTDSRTDNLFKHRNSVISTQEADREATSLRLPSALPTSSSIINFFMSAPGFWNANDSTSSPVNSDSESGHKFEPLPSDNEQLVWKAARASGAAPTYFRPCGRFLDGGLISNNPTLDILTEIQELHVAQRLKNKPVTPIAVVVSVGTGRMPIQPVETVDVFRPQNIMETYRSMLGFSFLGRILVEVATMSEGRVVDRARAWCASLGVPYFRLSAPLSLDVCLDTTDIKVLLLMVWETQVYLHRIRERIDLLSSLL